MSDTAQLLPEHLYVHVPLCRSKCRYCDFYSLADDGSDSESDIVTRILLDAVSWLNRGLKPGPVKTLYIGGGTPSMLGQHLPLLVTELGKLYPLQADAEVTVEANPDSLDARLVHLLVEAGVTRVSLGVQALSESALDWLGRVHDASDAIDAMLLVVASGLDLAVDLMCGIPHVSRELWRATLASVVECGASHVSVYPLSVEHGTPLADSVERGELVVPDADAAADEMVEACEVLEGLGLRRYETANYALPGKESRHNMAYWTARPYLGIGAGAHGMLSGGQARTTGISREAGIARLRYCHEPSGAFSTEEMMEPEALREDAMLGLRMREGISEALAVSAAVQAPLEALARDGLVERVADRWRTTSRGWLLGNEVFGQVWNSD